MRILHVLDHSIPLHSGYTFRTCEILANQRAMGWDTIQLTGVKQGVTEASPDWQGEFEFYRTQPVSTAWGRLRGIKHLAGVTALQKQLTKVIAETMPDVIHAHSPALNGLAAVRAARHAKLPLVYEVRAFWEDAAVDHGTSREGGLRYRLTRALETYVLRRADAVTTICGGLRDDIVARGVESQKVTVIPNGVNVEKFTVVGEPRAELQHKFGLQGKIVLGFIGSFYAYEGLTTLLHAMPGILQIEPKVNLLLVGGGPEEAQLRSTADALGLKEQVIFVGRVPHEEVQQYYSLVDILVYPRLPMRLTNLVTPLKPLEAMAQGRLVLASDVGGHRELIKHGENGVLFQAGSKEDLQRQLSHMLHDPEMWESRRAAGRRFVERDRNWGKIVADYERVYAAALRHTRND